MATVAQDKADVYANRHLRRLARRGLRRADTGEAWRTKSLMIPLRLREHQQLTGAFTRVLIKPLDLADLRQAVESSLTEVVRQK